MYIGVLSKRAGASAKAIRHYEKIGLLQNIQRSGKYRVYDEHHVVIITMIKQAQALGFKLSEIAPLVISKHKDNRFPIEIANQAIDDKRQQLQHEILKAQQLDKDLASLKAEVNNLFPKV